MHVFAPRRCYQQPGGPQQAWQALLAIFERTILNTHRSKFSQFLVFYMCLEQPDLCARHFVDFLLSRLKVCVVQRLCVVEMLHQRSCSFLCRSRCGTRGVTSVVMFDR